MDSAISGVLRVTITFSYKPRSTTCSKAAANANKVFRYYTLKIGHTDRPSVSYIKYIYCTLQLKQIRYT